MNKIEITGHGRSEQPCEHVQRSGRSDEGDEIVEAGQVHESPVALSVTGLDGAEARKRVASVAAEERWADGCSERSESVRAGRTRTTQRT